MDRYTAKSQIFWYNILMLQYKEKTESCLQMFLSQDAALPVKQKQSFAESFKSLLKSVSHIYGESFISTHIIQYLYKMAERESKDCNPLIH